MSFWSYLRDFFLFRWLIGNGRNYEAHSNNTSSIAGADNALNKSTVEPLHEPDDDIIIPSRSSGFFSSWDDGHYAADDYYHDSADDYAHDFDDFDDDY